MELDSDLGIDSIKRVEIFSAVQERLPDSPQVKSEHLGTLRTLRQVVEFLSEEKTEEQMEAAPVQNRVEVETSAITNGAPASNGYRPSDLEISASGQELRRFVLSVHPITADNPREHIVLPKGGEFWITDDGAGLADRLARSLSARGFKSRVLGIQSLGQVSSPSRLEGLIVLAPLGETSDRYLQDVLGLLKIASAGLRFSAKSGGSALITVSRMDGAFGLNDPRDPVSGGLAGLTKTAAKEWPEVHCKAIDLAVDWNNPDQIAKAIADEIFVEGPVEVGLSQKGPIFLSLSEKALPETCAKTANGIWFQDQELHSPLSTCHATFAISKKEVVLVTGGARGVTAEVAVAFARAAHPTLVLLGRSPEPGPEPNWLPHLTDEKDIKKALLAHANGSISPRELQDQYRDLAAQREIRNTLERIQETGAVCHYRCLDIRDESAVKATLTEIRNSLGPIRGIVHGAGVLADRRIEDKTIEQFDQVYSTKVTGLRSLLNSLNEAELKFLALMSSSTARFGRVGQVDYAAANEVLNKLAQQHARRWPQCRVVSINWGPWDGGMVTPQLKKIFAEEGLGLIPLKAGADFLVREINLSSDPAVEVVVLALPKSSDSTETVNGETVVRESSQPASQSPLTTHHSPTLTTVAFERTLNVDEYPFLTSHVIDGRAVLPLAMMMEWLAHGALHGNPGLVFHGLDNIRVFRGVILEEDQPCTIRVLAGPGVLEGSVTRVPVELHSTKEGGGGDQTNGKGLDGRLGHPPLTAHHSPIVNARAEVILATRLPIADVLPPEFQVESYLRDPSEVYSQILFHGPHLQGIEQVQGFSKHGIIGMVTGAPAPASWIQDPLRHVWLTDPLAVDAAIQLAVLWAYEEHGMASLPCFVGRYRQFRRFSSRENLRVVFQALKMVAQRVSGDLTLLDREGKVVARLENYESVLDAHLNQAFRRNRLRHRETQPQDSGF
jgi:NAD(P)-dependent dehydrogenase (short-subunit alcohol dehydrogenase family)